jgi:unsaturated chondroitin disaccharide hydrolase
VIDIKPLQPADLLPKIAKLWDASAPKILAIDKDCTADEASPVHTVQGKYTAKGWTDWTRGFQHGSAILQFDATGDESFLTLGRDRTLETMAGHLTHVGVHDHGFNNVSTYGNLLRLMHEGRIPHDPWQQKFYELALQLSGAVQASRWTRIDDGTGYICSFNGPQSLFVDTIRSCRSLSLAHALCHTLFGEQDEQINLLGRMIEHATNTAKYNVYYGEGRDHYDLRGRAVHEAIFNVTNGVFRCPSTQQGYSPFSTWTRGLSWAMAGYPEELEYLETREDAELQPFGGRTRIVETFLKAATAVCDFYIENTPTDGIPYWDTGAPNLHKLGDYLDKPADPYNDHEPVDSSAAAIGAQGLIRLGKYLGEETDEGKKYFLAGLTVLDTLLGEPYLNGDPEHHGLLLHSQYHRPGGWDHVPEGRNIPCGEATMWGDYHGRELALYVQRMAEGKPYYTFYAGTAAAGEQA